MLNDLNGYIGLCDQWIEIIKIGNSRETGNGDFYRAAGPCCDIHHIFGWQFPSFGKPRQDAERRPTGVLGDCGHALIKERYIPAKFIDCKAGDPIAILV